MRLCVYRDIKGASWCGTADLDKGELGDRKGWWALWLGGPCLLLVLLPALVLMVDKLQVVLHQVHVFREVALIQPWDRDIKHYKICDSQPKNKPGYFWDNALKIMVKLGYQCFPIHSVHFIQFIICSYRAALMILVAS